MRPARPTIEAWLALGVVCCRSALWLALAASLGFALARLLP